MTDFTDENKKLKTEMAELIAAFEAFIEIVWSNIYLSEIDGLPEAYRNAKDTISKVTKKPPKIKRQNKKEIRNRVTLTELVIDFLETKHDKCFTSQEITDAIKPYWKSELKRSYLLPILPRLKKKGLIKCEAGQWQAINKAKGGE